LSSAGADGQVVDAAADVDQFRKVASRFFAAAAATNAVCHCKMCQSGAFVANRFRAVVVVVVVASEAAVRESASPGPLQKRHHRLLPHGCFAGHGRATKPESVTAIASATATPTRMAPNQDSSSAAASRRAASPVGLLRSLAAAAIAAVRDGVGTPRSAYSRGPVDCWTASRLSGGDEAVNGAAGTETGREGNVDNNDGVEGETTCGGAGGGGGGGGGW
jgi:hypothetical protein